MRRYVRHATDVPVVIRLRDVAVQDTEYLRNISKGGMCFLAKVPLPVHRAVQVQIPLIDPELETEAEVVWCREAENGFEVGVRFAGADDEADARLVSEVCKIEDYKQEIWISEGRRVTGEQAALAWIRTHR